MKLILLGDVYKRQLYKKFGYKSTMQIPKIDKVVVNVGCGEAKENACLLYTSRCV